ncbi:hypothetical protein AWB77_01446 [Caballeronia fortuita]|uniref:Uncharacterized protein n=1 Tax=Caballeronia fortuita TaxID=1777138 RepID=A0A158A737_9BURK|nr:hypothetical protein AWB77_01446 [Caballeronia fortuita]
MFAARLSASPQSSQFCGPPRHRQTQRIAGGFRDLGDAESVHRAVAAHPQISEWLLPVARS